MRNPNSQDALIIRPCTSADISTSPPGDSSQVRVLRSAASPQAPTQPHRCAATRSARRYVHDGHVGSRSGAGAPSNGTATAGAARGRAAPAPRSGVPAVRDDGGGPAARRHDRTTARARGDRVRPRGRDARLQRLRRRRPRDGPPHDGAGLHPEPRDSAPRSRRLGLRPRLRRPRPPERDLPAVRHGRPLRDGHGRARGDGAARDPARLRERGLRPPAPRGGRRCGEQAGGAGARAERLRGGTGLRAQDGPHRHCVDAAGARQPDHARAVRAARRRGAGADHARRRRDRGAHGCLRAKPAPGGEGGGGTGAGAGARGRAVRDRAARARAGGALCRAARGDLTPHGRPAGDRRPPRRVPR